MTIPELVDSLAMEHIAMRGCIKGMDPFAQHMLKTSNDPLMRFRRWWIRAMAIKQCIEANKRQEKLNAQFARTERRKGADMMQTASIDPWLHEDMRRKHKAQWNDPDFQGFVKREEPKIFPKIEAR